MSSESLTDHAYFPASKGIPSDGGSSLAKEEQKFQEKKCVSTSNLIFDDRGRRMPLIEWITVAFCITTTYCVWFFILHCALVVSLNSGSSDTTTILDVDRDETKMSILSSESTSTALGSQSRGIIDETYEDNYFYVLDDFRRLTTDLSNSAEQAVVAFLRESFLFQNYLAPPILYILETSKTQIALWDHPEPNYVWSPAIAEFWSVVSAIPITGGMLLYLSWRGNFDYKLRLVYCLSFNMYNAACHAHLTLHKNIFEVTLSSVMFTCIVTFFLYAHIAPHAVECAKCAARLAGLVTLSARSVLSVAFMSVVIYYATHLPGWWVALEKSAASGGVWTLFAVQTPPVLIAFVAASFLYRETAKDHVLKEPLGWLSIAGGLLSIAMGLSLLEIYYGFSHGNIDFGRTLFGLESNKLLEIPVIHIAIHVIEQVGVYIYSMALGLVQHNFVSPSPSRKAYMRFTESFWWIPLRIPYCEVVSTPSRASAAEVARHTSGGA